MSLPSRPTNSHCKPESGQPCASVEFRESIILAPNAESSRKPTLQQRVDRVDAVDPPHLFTLFACPRAVGDRHLHDAAPGEEQPGGQFWLDVETYSAESEARERLTAHHLVRSLHVGQLRTEQQVGQRRQKAV